MNEQVLYLKWGSLKGWDNANGDFLQAILDYRNLAPVTVGVMQRQDTDTQKQALCRAIDACTGRIVNEWSGEEMSKSDAKTYIMEYRA